MGAQAAEKEIQVRNTGLAEENWRFSAPKGLGRTWALRRTRRGPAGQAQPPPFPRLSACAPPGPPKAAAGSPIPSPPDAASEPERPGRGGPNGGSPPANRRRKPARSPPPPPRRSPRAGGGACLTAAPPSPAHTTAQWGPRTCTSAPPHRSARLLVGHASAHRTRPPPPSLPPNLWSAQRGLPLGPRQGRP